VHAINMWGVVIDVFLCFATSGSFIFLFKLFHHLVILAISGYMSDIFAAYCTIW
jgi:hypothetical protein